MTSVTNIDDLMPHLRADMTAKEFGAAVIRLVPVKLKRQLALEARDRLGKTWTDSTVTEWLAPSRHRPVRVDYALRTKNAAAKRWTKQNSQHVNTLQRKRRATNGSAMRKRDAAYWRTKRENSVTFRLTRALRSRVYEALKNNTKTARTIELVGCSIEELRTHLEAQFTPGMTWASYGEWHVDHRVPCASFDLSDPAQQRAAFHWANLQPLWASANAAKGSQHNGKRHRYA